MSLSFLQLSSQTKVYSTKTLNQTQTSDLSPPFLLSLHFAFSKESKAQAPLPIANYLLTTLQKRYFTDE